MLITKTSYLTGKIHTLEIPVTEAEMQKWRMGTLIQQAMPDLSVDDREFILFGATAEERAKAFPKLSKGSDQEIPDGNADAGATPDLAGSDADAG